MPLFQLKQILLMIVGCWLLSAVCCLLPAASWLLAAGCWLLAAVSDTPLISYGIPTLPPSLSSSLPSSLHGSTSTGLE
jgi:hypothetical protein